MAFGLRDRGACFRDIGNATSDGLFKLRELFGDGLVAGLLLHQRRDFTQKNCELEGVASREVRDLASVTIKSQIKLLFTELAAPCPCLRAARVRKNTTKNTTDSATLQKNRRDRKTSVREKHRNNWHCLAMSLTDVANKLPD